jgi:hypothetical protein
MKREGRPVRIPFHVRDASLRARPHMDGPLHARCDDADRDNLLELVWILVTRHVGEERHSKLIIAGHRRDASSRCHEAWALPGFDPVVHLHLVADAAGSHEPGQERASIRRFSALRRIQEDRYDHTYWLRLRTRRQATWLVAVGAADFALCAVLSAGANDPGGPRLASPARRRRGRDPACARRRPQCDEQNGRDVQSLQTTHIPTRVHTRDRCPGLDCML